MTGFDDLKRTIGPAREVALPLVPDVMLSDATMPAEGTAGRRGRPVAERRLVADSVGEVFEAIHSVIGVLDEVVLSVVQKMLNQLHEQACPLLADNKKLTDTLLALTQEYGIRLYLDTGSEWVHVGIRAVPAHGLQKANSSTPAALAGVFTLSIYSKDGGSTGRTNVAVFPQLVAARSADQARTIWNKLQEPKQTEHTE